MFLPIKRNQVLYFFIAAVIYISTGSGLNAESRIFFNDVVGIDEKGSVERTVIEKPKVVLSKSEIYHYEILNVYLYEVSDLNVEYLSMRIFKNDVIHHSVGSVFNISFFQDSSPESQSRLKAVYLPDWNEKEGSYEIKLYYGEKQLESDEKIIFTLKRRPLPFVKKGISIVDLEMNDSIKNRTFKNPAGLTSDYPAILEWAQFMNADALWILSGETTSFKKRPAQNMPWDKGPLENLNLLKKIAGQYDIDIGAYIMSFYVPGKYGVPERYKAGIGYNSNNDYLYPSKHISLVSEQRIQDIIDLAHQFQNDPYIAYIGFDFIRTGRADGYELGPAVIDETNIKTPPDWETLSVQEKIKWFARKVEVEKDPLIIEKWRWWRAHQVAEIVHRIIEEAQITKPVWVYTLGWNHGKEHGQDPVMFFDAGITIDAVMLYEANRQQFARLLDHWKSYIEKGEGNIIVGNCIDYTLLDSDSLSPPEELFRRNVQGYRNILKNGFASGIFIHDLARAFWGRKGGHLMKEYALAYVSSVHSLKKDLGVLDLLVDVTVDDYSENNSGRVEISGHIYLKNNGTEPLRKINVSFIRSREDKDITFYFNDAFFNVNNLEVGGLDTFESKRLDFTLIKQNELFTEGKIGFFKVEIKDIKGYHIIKFLKLDKPESIVKSK